MNVCFHRFYLVSPGYPLLLPCQKPLWVLLGRNTLGKAETLRVDKALGRFLRRQKSTNCWGYHRKSWSMWSMHCVPYLVTQKPCAYIYLRCLYASDTMNCGSFLHVFYLESLNHHLLIEGGSPSTNGKISLPLGFQQMIICALGAKVLAPVLSRTRATTSLIRASGW